MLAGKGWLFVENPKTGTRSIDGVLTAKGGQRVGPTHCSLMFTFIKSQTFRDIEANAADLTRAVVVRNPWDRIVSMWAFTGKRRGVDFDVWLNTSRWVPGVGLDATRVPQICWAWKCDRIIRFENLEEEFGQFCFDVGLGEVELPRKNESIRPPYRDVFTPKTRAIVADRFAPDINDFGYEF